MGVGNGVVIVNRSDERKRDKSEDQGKNRGTFRGGGKATNFVGKIEFFLEDKHSCILVKTLSKAKVKCSYEIPRRD